MSLYELFIGFRYLKSKKNQGFISFNTVLSIFIVFIGVFILIVVISVMNGFQSQIKDKILDVDSHITVSSIYNSRGKIRNYKVLSSKVLAVKDVKDVNPFILGEGLFRYKTEISYIMVRGVGKKGEMPEDVKKFIVQGPKDFTVKNGVFIGQEMAVQFNLRIGQWIEIIVPKGKLTASTGVEPGLGKFKVAGYFKTGYYDFDTKLIVMSLPQAQRLYSVGDIVWGLGVKIKDVFRMKEVSRKVRSVIGPEYVTTTAEDKNQNLFYALKLEKLIMTIILFLVIISAGFTIMGTLVMVVMEKRRAIGILKAMGAKPNSIMVIFILEGFFIGVFGTLFGVVTGLAVSLNLEAIILWVESSINEVGASFYKIFNLGYFYKVSIVPSHVYYIDTIPTEINPEFIVFIAIFAVFLSTVAAIFPAWSASRLHPVETIRYE